MSVIDKYTVLGMMSGTSLDGLDLALCEFTLKDGNWNFQILNAETLPYPSDILNRLREAQNLNALDFVRLHKFYGDYLGKAANNFLQNKKKPDFIASHGHTVFHAPAERLTFQIGDGAFIAAQTGITTVADFRTMNTALHGQGAPLVPIGDELLFSGEDYCLNLGGFANVSYRIGNKNRIAYDICPANYVLNFLAKKQNLPYDFEGKISRSGEIDADLLQKMNSADYFSQKPPKSLGREFVEETVLAELEKSSLSLPSQMRTYTEHIAEQIALSLNSLPHGSLMITGGGAHNKFLIETITKKLKHKLVLPNSQIIDFKEALIFAFLGLLRMRNEANCLASVTGARQNNSGGQVFLV